jgi:acyl dehydratase
VPRLERLLDAPRVVAYAGATWDWHRLHYDTEYATAKQLPGPIVDGQVYGALLVEQLQDWLGPHSFVRELELTYRNLVFAGETLRCHGRVTEVSDDQLSVELTVSVLDADGTRPRTAAGPCRAVVLLGRADGPGRRSG